MEFIFGLIGLIIGGAAAFFFFQGKLQQVQRKLDSSEKKLERANRAIEDAESLRSQNTIQAQDLQNARQQIQSLETSYQSQLRNLEQSYELQLQGVEKAQGNPAALAESQDRIRQIEQSYQAQIQELQANYQNEKQAIEQSHQAQIRELQQAHQQVLEDFQQRPAPPVQSFDSPPIPTETTKNSGWAETAMGAAAIAGAAGLGGWAMSNFLNRDEEIPVTQEASEGLIAEEPLTETNDWQVAESSFEVPDETPEENWANEPLGQAVATEAELMGWTEPEQPEVAESLFEIPDETPDLALDDNWADEPLGQAVATETEFMGWTEPEPIPVLEEITEEPIAETNDWQVAESPFEIPDETPDLALDDNWADQPLGEAILPDLTESDLSSWTEPEPVPVLEEITEEPVVEENDWQVAEFPFEISDETPALTLEENWVDASLGEVELTSWAESEAPQLLEENIETPDSWDLGENIPSDVGVELPSLESLEDFSDTSSSSELEFLSMLQEEPSLDESTDISSFMETAEPALPDFLGEETLNDDLQLLDIFPSENQDLTDIPETLAGETNAPFINFFDSETEKSDLEFLEMLKTDDDINRSVLDESDDLFGDLFSPEEPTPIDNNDLFASVESQNPKVSQDGLEELFGDDTFSFDNWDLPSSEKPSAD